MDRETSEESLEATTDKGAAPAWGRDATNPWADRLGGLEIGPPRHALGLTVFPLLGPRDGAVDYWLLGDALACGAVTVGETGDSGAIPELDLRNHGARSVFVLDGEELVGAKQNRIVNTSVLVEGGTRVVLPVSCVEAGRWHTASESVRSEGTQYNARGRQQKVAEVSLALALEGCARADQGRIWADVEAKLARLDVPSSTGALYAAADARRADLERYRSALAAPLAGEVGAVYALGRDLVGVDIFDRSATQAALLPRIITGYALDALDERPTASPPPAAVVFYWLRVLKQAFGIARTGIGLGENVRLSAPGIAGAALVFEGTVVHLSAFRAEPQPGLALGGVRRGQRRRPQ